MHAVRRSRTETGAPKRLGGNGLNCEAEVAARGLTVAVERGRDETRIGRAIGGDRESIACPVNQAALGERRELMSRIFREGGGLDQRAAVAEQCFDQRVALLIKRRAQHAARGGQLAR